jgi:hypothetical protein
VGAIGWWHRDCAHRRGRRSHRRPRPDRVIEVGSGFTSALALDTRDRFLPDASMSCWVRRTGTPAPSFPFRCRTCRSTPSTCRHQWSCERGLPLSEIAPSDLPLSGATNVTFNGVTGTITKDTETTIKVKVPMGATTGKIKVVTPGGPVKTATVFTVT